MKTMMARVMESLSREDRAVRDKVNPVVLKMAKSEDVVFTVKAKELKIRNIGSDEIGWLLSKCEGLKILNFDQNKEIIGTLKLTKSWARLKKLRLSNADVEG